MICKLQQMILWRIMHTQKPIGRCMAHFLNRHWQNSCLLLLNFTRPLQAAEASQFSRGCLGLLKTSYQHWVMLPLCSYSACIGVLINSDLGAWGCHSFLKSIIRKHYTSGAQSKAGWGRTFGAKSFKVFWRGYYSGWYI